MSLACASVRECHPTGLCRIRKVTVAYMFAGLPVADYAASYDWYVRLFGWPADMFPHDGEAVWRLAPSGSIYAVEDRRSCGGSGPRSPRNTGRPRRITTYQVCRR
jgi:hypothetical protein